MSGCKLDLSAETPEYEIRLMKKEDIPGVKDLLKETSFLERRHSIDLWFEYDPEGFFVAVTSDGKLIGVCACILQHNDLMFAGMYIVKSTFQQQGIGRKLYDRAKDRIGDRNVAFNAEPHMVKYYMNREGYFIQADWRSVFYVAKDVGISEMTTELPGVDLSVIALDDAETISAVAEYEASVLGFSRNCLVSKLCKEKDSVTIVARYSLNNSVCGYGNIKENMNGSATIAPLYANDKSVAEIILYRLIKAFPLAESKGVSLLTIDCNQDALEMIDRFGFENKVVAARLYRFKEIDIQFKKVFGQHNTGFSII